MNIVLFLGAGFSAAFNLPVMNEFLSFADTSQRIDQNDKNFIGRLVLEARRANSFLESSPTNLEDILSFSVMADRLSLNRDSDNSYNYKIRHILQRIFTQVDDSINYWNKFDKLNDFLTFDPIGSKKHDLSIITTNYDITIESSLYHLGLFTDPSFSYWQIDDKKNIQVRGNLYRPDGVPVMKLHGSVNWYESKTPSNSFDVEGRVVAIHSARSGSNSVSLPYSCASDYKSEIPPIIIPPSFLKPDLKGPLEDIWGRAAEKLRAANLLVFVGYSFPLTDTEMLYFLATSLTENSGLRNILLVDPSGLEIEKRLLSTASKFGSHFKNFLNVIPKKWETTNLGPYL